MALPMDTSKFRPMRPSDEGLLEGIWVIRDMDGHPCVIAQVKHEIVRIGDLTRLRYARANLA